MSEPQTTPTVTQEIAVAEATVSALSSIASWSASPTVICDVPGEFVMLKGMPAVSMTKLNGSLLMRIPHTIKHIFNPNQQDIQRQPGRHDPFGQELFRCEFAYLANILEGETPETCDIIIRLIHSSARRARVDHTTRLLQTITVMLGNELVAYIEQCQAKAKRNKKAPNYYRPFVRQDKKDKQGKQGKKPRGGDQPAEPPKTATPPQNTN